MAESAVVVERLRVPRGGVLALDNLSLTVAPGQVTGLLGPSGSGKSTLIRAVVGVQVVESGTVTVLGSPAGSLEVRRRVGYMTQAAAVYADLTVRENLAYFARVVGVAPGRVDEAIATVDLRAYGDREVSRLSGGQRARVSLATALVGDPELIVLDEPTVGLDPVLRRDLWAAFSELAAAGRTLIVSSHVMDEAEHCDELLLLRDGRLVATGSPEEIRGRTGAADMDTAFLRLIEQAG